MMCNKITIYSRCFFHSDNDYIMSLETFVRHNNHIVLVMPFFDHNKFQV